MEQLNKLLALLILSGQRATNFSKDLFTQVIEPGI